jgi:hypothetical protein
MRQRLAPLALVVLVAVCGCALAGSRRAQPAVPARTFVEVSVPELRAHPDAHVGDLFEERFTFLRVWWSRDRARPNRQALDLPTHFEARVVAAPLYVVRIEFPPEADAQFERTPEGTDLRLRVRFLRLHAANGAPVFALERTLPDDRRSDP